MLVFETTKLVPVAQWQFDLWEVKFWTAPPNQGGTVIKSLFLVSTDTHVEFEALERSEGMVACRWVSWDVVKENVGRPRQIGQLYGSRIDESGWSAGERLMGARS